MKNNLPKLFKNTDRHIPPAIRKKIQAHRRRLERQYCPRGASVIQAALIDQVVQLTAFADLCAAHRTLKKEQRRFERAAKSALMSLKEINEDECTALHLQNSQGG